MLRRPTAQAAGWLLGGVTVGLQVCYPLTRGRRREAVSIATVATFSAATLVHTAAARGAAAVGRLLTVAVAALGVEAVGVRTGVPFGRYHYTGRLGPRLAGVPAVVPLAWVMMTGPALAASRRLARGRTGRAVLATAALASWDLFLDPQMVADGNWEWDTKGPALQGIPLTNYAGWVAVSAALTQLATPAAPVQPERDALPVTLYLWTYLGSVLANAAFLRRPAVAVSGGIGMGLVAIPLLRDTLRRAGAGR